MLRKTLYSRITRCQVPPASDPPNLNATGAPCSCMSPSQLEYAMMMTKQIWNTCPDDERMNNEVCGVEEDEPASEYEYCMDETMYPEGFNEDDVMLMLTSTNFIMD